MQSGLSITRTGYAQSPGRGTSGDREIVTSISRVEIGGIRRCPLFRPPARRPRHPSVSVSGSRAARILARPGWVILTLLSLFTIKFVAGYLTFDPEVYFPEQRELYQQRELVLGVHVICGILLMIIGPFQFIRADTPPVRPAAPNARRHLSHRRDRARAVRPGPRAYRVHRTRGLAGLHLPRSGHAVDDVDRIRMVLAHRYSDHRRWMIRSYSLMFAAPMLRLLSLIYFTLSGAAWSRSPSRRRTRGSHGCAGCRTSLLALWFTRRRKGDPWASMG